MARIEFIKKSAALKIAGCRSSKWNADKAKGLMPQPVYFSATDARYLLHEVEIACAAWASGTPADEIKALISSLQQKRKSLLNEVMSDALSN
jgi:hypothetical protein